MITQLHMTLVNAAILVAAILLISGVGMTIFSAVIAMKEVKEAYKEVEEE